MRMLSLAARHGGMAWLAEAMIAAFSMAARRGKYVARQGIIERHGMQINKMARGGMVMTMKLSLISNA